MLPSKPVRKGPGINPSPVGVKMTGGVPMPTRKSAAPFGSVDKGVYKRPSTGITPGGVTVNDDDAGQGTGNVRGNSSSSTSGGIKAWDARKGGGD